MFRFNRLVPSQIEDRLIWLGQFISDATWEIADITIKLIDELDALQSRVIRISQYLVFKHRKVPDVFDDVMRLGVMDVYRYVADITGFSSRTIRDYVRLGKLYPIEVREKYDVLPYSFFRFAARYSGRETDILELALRLMDVNGGKLSLDMLEANLMPGPVEQTMDDANRYLDLQENLHDRWDDPPPSFSDKNEDDDSDMMNDRDSIILRQLSHVIEFIIDRVQKLSLKGKHQERIAQALWSLLETIREIENETTIE